MVPLEDPAEAGAEAGPLAHVVGLLCCRALGEWGGGMGEGETTMRGSVGFWAPGRRKAKAEAHTSTNRIPWAGVSQFHWEQVE